MIRFECDYGEGAAQPVLDLLQKTNLEQTPGYGMDDYCDQARGLIRKLCDAPDAGVHFFVGATQANFTVVDALLKPWQGVLCADSGHINVHETGAYAQRATRPDDMEHALNPALHAENRKAFRYLLSLSDQPAVWAAWGNIILKRDYLMDCMRDFAADGKAAGAKWYTAGPLLKSGQPHHPLYLKKDTQLLDFDIDAYLCAQRAK